MAITPSEARAAKDERAIARHQEEIDAYLRSEFERGNHRPFYNTRGMSESTLDALTLLYQSAGWRVERGADRDGPYIVFEER